jgi:hypothetical protein
VVTDPMPRDANERRAYELSDEMVNVPLPNAQRLGELGAALEQALTTGLAPPVRKAGVALLVFLSQHFEVETPGLSVLGLRPQKVLENHFSYELFGDYTFETQKIRVWMRTAVLGKVTSFRGLLNTVVHEFFHHLDVKRFGFPDTPHTRGFYTRIDGLYHLCLGTPPGKRMPLIWRKRGNVWAADWPAMRAAVNRQSRG